MSVHTTSITIDELLHRELIITAENQTYELAAELQAAVDSPETESVEEHPILRKDAQKALLEETAGHDAEFVHKYAAIAEKTQDLAFETRVSLVFSLDQFLEPRLPTSGIPDTFTPVRGSHLQTAIKLHPRSIVYAWRDNCGTCETMADSLAEVFDRPSDQIALFAVYGPDCAIQLQQEFDIHGAPTTLFCVDGAIDSRLIGPQHSESVAAEAQILLGE